jgi:hypothetical protein
MSLRFAFLFTLLLLRLGLQGQGEHYCAGRLGTHMVYMVLRGGEAGPLQGQYFYATHRKEIPLSGTTQNGRISFTETVEAQITGTWEGERDNFSFRGVWTSPNGKQLPYQLYTIDQAAYLEQRDGRQLADIQDTHIRALAGLYEEATLPFTATFSTERPELELARDAYGYVFADTSELYYYNALYAGQCVLMPDYFALLTLHSYSPGAFGIDNAFIRLATFRYDGKVISQVELGCHSCYDSNIGSADYYATQDSCVFSDGRITCYRVDEHGSLGLGDEQNEFLERTQDTLTFRVERDGVVVPE